ncbi:MAG: ethanolamine ammonia-lyase subunit EutC [Burkholderiales bacterium]
MQDKSPEIVAVVRDALDIQAPVIEDPWHQLRRFTDARIALGRTGNSLPTAEVLRFGVAHAQAQTAVHISFDVEALTHDVAQFGLGAICVASAAVDRKIYLKRPDLGRKLNDESRAALADLDSAAGFDMTLVLGDGLSPLALHKHAMPLLAALLPLLEDWKLAPIVIASQARVALADEIGQALRSRMVAILIGERPGLSSPDSMGIYLTYEPRVGRVDAERNCISNIRGGGLSYAEAANKLNYLMCESRRLKLSGIRLKEQAKALGSNPEAPE